MRGLFKHICVIVHRGSWCAEEIAKNILTLTNVKSSVSVCLETTIYILACCSEVKKLDSFDYVSRFGIVKAWVQIIYIIEHVIR